jgi:hypothetical protein
MAGAILGPPASAAAHPVWGSRGRARDAAVRGALEKPRRVPRVRGCSEPRDPCVGPELRDCTIALVAPPKAAADQWHPASG